jgi:hypothetical protein
MNGKKINEFPSGSGTLSDDDIFLMMDNPLESGATTKSLSLGVLRTNINELVLSDLTTVSGIVDGVSGVLRADLTTVSGIVDGVSGILRADLTTVSGIVDGVSGILRADLTTVSGIVDGIIVTNSGDNRILTSTGSTRGINAESNLTFNGTTLGVSGALQVDKINIDDYAIKPTLPSQPGGRYVLAVSTDFLDVDTTQYSSVRGSGGFSVFGAKNPTIFIHNEEPLNYSPELKLYQGSIFSGSSTLTIGSYNQNNENAISNNRNINAIVSNGNYDLQLATTSGNIILEPGAAVKIYGITKMGDSDPFYQLDIGFDMLGGDLGITHNNNSYIAVKIPGDESYRYGGNGDNPAIVISSGLNVGIKNNFPQYALDVSGGASIGFRQKLIIDDDFIFLKNSDDLTILSTEEYILFGDGQYSSIEWWSRSLNDPSGVPILSWDSTLGIGIKKDNPSYTLDVNGSGNFSSGLFVNNLPVSISGHNHVSNDITDFTVAVSGIVINILQQLNIIGY